MKTIITTMSTPNQTIISTAKKIAEHFNLACIDRLKHSQSDFLSYHGISHCFILKKDGLYLAGKNTEYKWHPNTALLKLKNTQNQGKLIKAIDLKLGDTVLDLTIGLVSDTLILAYAVGSSGKVTAVESEKLIYTLTKYGIKHSEFEQVKNLYKRIKFVNDSYCNYLSALSNNSHDAVYLDPMFDKTNGASFGIDVLRGIANYNELSLEVIEKAKNIAKKRVVIKTRFGSKLQKSLVNAQISGNKRAGKVVYLIVKCT